ISLHCSMSVCTLLPFRSPVLRGSLEGGSRANGDSQVLPFSMITIRSRVLPFSMSVYNWPISDVVSEIGISDHLGHVPRSGARTPVRSYCEHLSKEHGVVCGRHSDRHPNSV